MELGAAMVHATERIAMKKKSGMTGLAKATPMTFLLLVAGGWPAWAVPGR